MTSFEPQAIGWTATMGLVPGYRWDEGMSVDEIAELVREKRLELNDRWTAAMDDHLRETGFSISCVMTDCTVVYPFEGGCPIGGEPAVCLHGSSNPRYVKPDQFEAFMAAVEAVVKIVQEGMLQTSCRIEFTPIMRSVYSRRDD